MRWFVEHDHALYLPLGHSPNCDLIAESHNGRLLRVQVKTSRRFRSGRWEIMLCTKGGNQSWSGVVKRLDPVRIDALFVVVGDGRRWYIPSRAIEGGTGIRLGGPKYANFEIEPDKPLSM